MAAAKRKKARKSRRRLISLKLGLSLLIFLAVWGTVAEWFVHHPRAWIAERREQMPLVVSALTWLGNPLADITDGLAITGHDAVYEYDLEAPKGTVSFAGLPVRTGYPAPDDIRIIDRGEFVIGWSDKLRHPVWCAYHVTKEAKFPSDKRPGFTKDRSVPAAPSPGDYRKSGFDRGHMVPNHAIASRYGEAAQKLTFKMSNISPQTPALNRGVWRDVEHRIADLWTARYGEIWVVVGSVSTHGGMLACDIDLPSQYYQVIIAQEGLNVRALAVLFSQDVDWGEWAARNIVSIDELEELTGLDFNPGLPSFIQSPLEAELPSRLWPVRLRDIFAQIALRFSR
jgi:endonuclease G